MERLEYFANAPASVPLAKARMISAGAIFWMATLAPGLLGLRVANELWRVGIRSNYWAEVAIASGVCLGLILLLGWIGTGLFAERRWAHAIALPLGRSWLALGASIFSIWAFEMLREVYPVRRLSDLQSLVRPSMLAPDATTIGLCLLGPGLVIWLLRQSRMPVALAQRNPRATWTDAFTRRELGMIITLLAFACWAGVVAFVDFEERNHTSRPGALVTPVIAGILLMLAVVALLAKNVIGWWTAAAADLFMVAIAAVSLNCFASTGPVYLDSSGVILSGSTLIACVCLTGNLWRSRPWLTAHTQ